ncbi:hypothetical protein D3C81_1622660 [compost metagenome]
MRDAVELLISQTDMEIQPQRLGDPRHDGIARSAAIDPANQFADQPTEGDRRVAVRAIWRPPGLFLRQCIGHRLPVVERFGREHPAQRRQTGAMAEQLAHRNALLAGGGELRPVVRHRRIQLQPALADQLQQGNAGECLGAGEQVENGVSLPLLTRLPPCAARPEIDDHLAANLDAQRRATLLMIVEEPCEGVGNRHERFVAMTLRDHWILLPSGRLFAALIGL